MDVFFEDSYGDDLLMSDMESLPRVGDTVMVHNETYVVSDVIWVFDHDTMYVTVRLGTPKRQPVMVPGNVGIGDDQSNELKDAMSSIKKLKRGLGNVKSKG